MTLSELHGGELYVVCFQFVSQFPMPFVVGLFCGFFSPEKSDQILTYICIQFRGGKRVQGEELLPTFVLKTSYFINVS